MDLDSGIVLVVLIIILELYLISYIKYTRFKKLLDSPEQADQKPLQSQVKNGKYNGVERRARKRSNGAIFQQPNGNWVFR